MPRAKPPKRGYFPRWPTPMLLEDDAVS
jgi:hypothetical protein